VFWRRLTRQLPTYSREPTPDNAASLIDLCAVRKDRKRCFCVVLSIPLCLTRSPHVVDTAAPSPFPPDALITTPPVSLRAFLTCTYRFGYPSMERLFRFHHTRLNHPVSRNVSRSHITPTVIPVVFVFALLILHQLLSF
jgi:hypothetical protein